METTQVILVDTQDRFLGLCGKLEAHERGLLHRAFSIFIFNSKGQMLMQQRAMDKYHSGGLWANACCSHPTPIEDIVDVAGRRLMEEMGFTTELEEIFSFTYKAAVGNGLTEYEFDHVYAGQYDGAVHINKEEVMDICYMNRREVRLALQTQPSKFAPWFSPAFLGIDDWWQRRYGSELD